MLKQYEVVLSYKLYIIAENEFQALASAQFEYESIRPTIMQLRAVATEMPEI